MLRLGTIFSPSRRKATNETQVASGQSFHDIFFPPPPPNRWYSDPSQAMGLLNLRVGDRSLDRDRLTDRALGRSHVLCRQQGCRV